MEKKENIKNSIKLQKNLCAIAIKIKLLFN